MLGFSAFSGAPLGSSGGVSATITVASQVINQVVNTLTTQAKANITNPSATSTFSLG